jgi:hypothetical protein
MTRVPPVGLSNVMLFSDIRVTQGLNVDPSTSSTYTRVAGKATLVRFQVRALLADIPYTDAACEVYRWPPGGPEELVGTVPGVLPSMSATHVAPLDYHYPDAAATIHCWVPGEMLSTGRNRTLFRFRALINSAGGTTWSSDLGGWRAFHRPASSYNLMLQVAYQLPSYEPSAITTFPDNYRAHLTGLTLESLGRLFPLADGVEVSRVDGSNSHESGLIYYLFPEIYACEFEASDDPRLTCDSNQRSYANAALLWFNAYAEIARMDGGNRDLLRRGMVVVPFTHTGGGQSCWGDHRVAGQSISLDDLDGTVMAHELSHCEGRPHFDVQLVPEPGGHQMVNTRIRGTASPARYLMYPVITFWDDWTYGSALDWRAIITNLRDDPYPPTAAAVTALDAVRNRFYIGGDVYPNGLWKPRFSVVLDTPVPLPAEPLSGAYAVVITDAGGKILIRWPFDVSFKAYDGAAPPFAPVDLLVPYPTGASRVRVEQGSKVLYEAAAPPSAPVLQFGQLHVQGDVAEVTWQASHPNQAPLRFAVDFSPDDGKTWTRLRVGLTKTSFVWDSQLAPATD